MKAADNLYTEYTLEEIIYQLAKVCDIVRPNIPYFLYIFYSSVVSEMRVNFRIFSVIISCKQSILKLWKNICTYHEFFNLISHRYIWHKFLIFSSLPPKIKSCLLTLHVRDWVTLIYIMYQISNVLAIRFRENRLWQTDSQTSDPIMVPLVPLRYGTLKT